MKTAKFIEWVSPIVCVGLLMAGATWLMFSYAAALERAIVRTVGF